EIFDKFRAWMTELYQQLTGVKVSPAVEAIFDRLHGDKLEAQYNERQKAAAEIQAMQEARAQADQREREYLLNIDPDDPRIAEGDEF
ncbi:hypothetical protein ABTL72_19395, partial [Acinetobacter baumannii]